MISNTFLVVPLRSLADENRRQKGYEILLLVAVSGLETLVIFFIGLGVFWDTDSPDREQAVRLCWILSLVFFVLGSISLAVYYKFAHTWRHLERERLSFLAWLRGETSRESDVEPKDNGEFTLEESSAAWEDWELNSQLDEENKKNEEKEETQVPEISQVSMLIPDWRKSISLFSDCGCP